LKRSLGVWFILGDSLLPHFLARSFGCSPNQF
jgi:hypothetical protein